MGTAPRSRAGLKYIIMAVISLLDDAIVVGLIILLLSHFIEVPLWIVVPVGAVLATWAVISVLVVRKNPQLGFENVVGATGVTTGNLSPKGTVRIGHELWAAKADGGRIAAGVTIIVVGQSGLLLTVVKKDEEQRVETSPVGVLR